MVNFHATVTDTLAASATADQAVAAGTARGVRTIRRSFYGSRMTYGSVVDDTIWGPTIGAPDDFGQIVTGPVTLGTTFTMLRDCNIVGVRIYKSPTLAGAIPVNMWDAAGNVLAHKVVTWVVDDGGWREIIFDTPIPVKNGLEYHWGYFYPNADTNFPGAIWVWNGQDSTNYPFWMKGLISTGSGVRSHAGWKFQGGTDITFTATGPNRSPADYYIDPIAEWMDDTPGYDGGGSYYSQWSNSSWFQTNFPILMFWANLGDYAAYANAGINVMATGDSATSFNIDQFKSQNAAHPGSLKWIPSLVPNDMSGPIAAMDDAVLRDIIVGYFVMDEPEFNQNPWFDPDTTLLWKNNARKIDASRIMWQNMSKMTADNQGFIFAPAGVDMVTKELNIRRYVRQTDIGSLDKYSLAASESYEQNVPVGRPNRFGIWTYPLCIQRVREITDGKYPIWGIVESTSEFPNLPVPSDLQKAVWAMLIAGAKGIEYFDHRFPDADVSQDFGAFLRNPPMLSAITALNTQIQSLKDALLAPDAGLVDSYTSAGTLTAVEGGYPIGAKIPLHYTSRVAAGKTWLIVQSIRSGATNATITCPSCAGKTFNVVGESRTVTVDGSGVLTDSFSSYQYHIYEYVGNPTYTAPTNSAVPAIGHDGTPQPGETLTCSKGGWNGSCLRTTQDGSYFLPQFGYQWQKDGVNIAGAVFNTYVPVSGDVGHVIKCRVTATNPAGSLTVDSGTVTILAPDAPPVNTVAPALTTDGTPQTGETISCSQGTWTSVLSLSYAYQWKRDGSPIVGATNTTYVLQSADQGHSIMCTVTATSTAGSTPANSNAVTPAAPSPPTNTVAPAVTPSGSPIVGALLTCAAGTWTGAPTYAYQWQRDSGSGFANIAGATASTYTTVTGDGGTSVRCVVTATNSAGSTSANSNTVTPTADSTAYFDAVMADSPLAYYRLDSGTPWVDSSGHGRNMTELTSGHAPTPTTGLVPSTINQGVHFDGFGAIGLGSDSTLDAITAITMEAWFKYGVTRYPSVIVSKGGRTALAVNNDGSIQVQIRWGADPSYIYTLSSPGLIASAPGTTYHAALTYDGTTIKCYLNGAEVASYTEAHVLNTSGHNLQISGDDIGSSTFSGTIDEVALYGTALSAARILAHYNAGIS